MLFEDGNRMDLSIKTPACAMEDYLSDTLCIKLLDKDGLLPDIPESNRLPVSPEADHQRRSMRAAVMSFFGVLTTWRRG